MVTSLFKVSVPPLEFRGLELIKELGEVEAWARSFLKPFSKLVKT